MLDSLDGQFELDKLLADLHSFYDIPTTEVEGFPYHGRK